MPAYRALAERGGLTLRTNLALWWDRDGLAMWYKRLEMGTYQLPVVSDDAQGVEIDATQLALLLSGVDQQSAKRRKRYLRVA